MANPLPPAPAPSTPSSTGETPSDYFERNIRTVELANAVARFLGLNPADEIPFEELTRRLAAAPPLSAARPSGLCPTCGDALRENEFLRERCADYETLKRAVNHSANCLPECADNPNGCVEACPRFNTARWLTDQQAEIERLRAALDAARADTERLDWLEERIVERERVEICFTEEWVEHGEYGSILSSGPTEFWFNEDEAGPNLRALIDAAHGGGGLPWTAHQRAARIARAAGTHPEGSNG